MTLEEKIQLLHGPMPGLLSPAKRPAGLTVGAGYIEGVPRLSIPRLVETDASLGVSNLMDLRKDDVATALPSGLSLASSFELASDEADFYDEHRTYDRHYSVTHLVNWLAVALYGHAPDERREFVRACARGTLPADLPGTIAALLARHAPVAAVMGDFYDRFRHVSRATPYPLEALGRAPHGDARGPGSEGRVRGS